MLIAAIPPGGRHQRGPGRVEVATDARDDLARTTVICGLRAGQKAPEFSARDQLGKTQTLDTLRGSKGTVLLFYRSADWCPYCKGQLIQLQAAKERFEKQGIKLAGISYDSLSIVAVQASAAR